MKQNSENMNKQMNGEFTKTQFGSFTSIVQAIIPMLIAAFLLADQFISIPVMR